jgi:hypothetical protein
LAASPSRVPLLLAALATITRKSLVKFRMTVIRLSVASVSPPTVSNNKSTGIHVAKLFRNEGAVSVIDLSVFKAIGKIDD